MNTEVETKGKRYLCSGRSAKEEKVTLAIRPEDVILYSMDIPPQKSSAMNIFKGKMKISRISGCLKR